MSARSLILTAILLAGCGSVPAADATPSDVPWVALPAQHLYVEAPLASPVPPLAVPAGTPACQASQLEGVNLGMSGATGNVNMPLLFRNRSATACFLEGYPDATVLAPTGEVLAAGSGVTGRGTYFNDGPVVQLMLKAGEPPLPAPGPGYTPPLGEAFMNFSWYACRQEQAGRLALDLPNGGGRLVIPFAMQSYYSAACDGSSYQQPAIFRGPFSPTGVEWPPGADYIKMQVTIDAPASVKRGSTLVYFVTIRDVDHRPYVLSPCPDYMGFLTGVKTGPAYQLNCGPVGGIAPGARARFEMRLDVPSSYPTGTSHVNWGLGDGRIDPSTAQAPVEIT